jgi:hypothetical protein
MRIQEIIREVSRMTARYGGATLRVGGHAMIYTDRVWELEEGVLAVERKGWRIATVDLSQELGVSLFPDAFLKQDYPGRGHSYDDV